MIHRFDIKARPAANNAMLDLLDIDAGKVIESFVSEPGVGIGVITDRGEVLWVNDQAAKIFHGPDAVAKDYIGTVWSETMPEAWAQERLDLLARMRRVGKPVMMRTFWRGRQHVTWIHPVDLPQDPGEPAQFLTVTHHVDNPGFDEKLQDGKVEFVESGFSGLGELGILSVRELEVLSLIGQGLSTKEIARILFRSEKTIDGHRQSIGKKLGVASKTELAQMAMHAGLRLQDAGKPRV